MALRRCSALRLFKNFYLSQATVALRAIVACGFSLSNAAQTETTVR